MTSSDSPRYVPYPPTPNNNRESRGNSLPGGIIVLAIVGGLIGCLGLISSLQEMIAPAEQNSSMSALLDEVVKQSPPGQREQLLAFQSDEQMVQLLDDILNALRSMIPYRPVYNFGNFVVSALALIGCIGLLKQRNWGRLVEIAFFVVATLYAVVYGYLMIPGIVNVIFIVTKHLKVDLTSVDLTSDLYLFWTLLSFLFAFLHGWIVYYLTRPSIKKLYLNPAP